MVSTRSRTRASTAAPVSHARQSGIAAFAKTGKSGAGLSAAATTGKNATLASTKNAGNKEQLLSISPLKKTTKRKFEYVEDTDADISKRLRKVDGKDDSGFKVPEISPTVSKATVQNLTTTRLRRSRSSPTFASTLAQSSQDTATDTSYSPSSVLQSSQDVRATQDTTLTRPSPSPSASPEPESDSSIEHDDVFVEVTSTKQDLSQAGTKRENQNAEECEATSKKQGTDSILAKEETIMRNIRPDAADINDDEEKEKFASKADDNIENDDRPSSYHNLISLHSSFLTALSFHYAHNNPSAPADLKEFLPCIEKIWKKRKVVIEDFRKMVYIANGKVIDGKEPGKADGEHKNSQRENGPDGKQYLIIANYGPGKTCLELAKHPESNPFSPPIKDEEELIMRFRENLEMLWQQWQDSGPQKNKLSADNSTSLANGAFLSYIPLETLHTSTNSFTTPHVGRQRLLEFTEGSLKLRSLQSRDSTIQESAARARRSSRKSLGSTSSSGTLNRKSSLLQRIRDKESQSARLPPPPTPEQSLRIAAGQHMDKVCGILRCMRPTQAKLTPQRRAYRWDEAVSNVVQSLKMPVSKKEVEVCLEMIAEDVKCEWVKIVEIKEVRSLVLMSGGLKGWISFPEKKAAVEGRKEMEKKH